MPPPAVKAAGAPGQIVPPPETVAAGSALTTTVPTAVPEQPAAPVTVTV
jgi:hypothetical protein